MSTKTIKDRPFTVFFNGRIDSEIKPIIDKYGAFLDYYTDIYEGGGTFVIGTKEENWYVDTGMKYHEMAIHYKIKPILEELYDEAKTQNRPEDMINDAFFASVHAFHLTHKKEYEAADNKRKQELDIESTQMAQRETLDYILFNEFRGVAPQQEK